MKSYVIVLVTFALLQTVAVTTAHAGGTLPPISEDIRVGNQELRELTQRFGDESAAVDSTQSKLQHLVQRLGAVSDLPSLPYEVHVLPSTIANAICLPGGKILVFAGIWDKKNGFIRKDNEGEAAAILAHEIAHAANRHWARHEYGNESMHSAEYEMEADYRGMLNLARAGYNPRVMLKIFSRRVIKEAQEQSINVPEISSGTREWQRTFASHPTHRRRTAAMRAHLQEAMKIYHTTQHEGVATE